MLYWPRAIDRLTKARENNNVAYDPTRALELLRIGSGRADATFRDGQEDAIRHIVEGVRCGSLPAALLSAADIANARKGTTRKLGQRSLNQWVLDYLRADDAAERLLLLTQTVA